MEEEEEEEGEEEGVGLDQGRDPQTDGFPRKRRGGKSQSINTLLLYLTFQVSAYIYVFM